MRLKKLAKSIEANPTLLFLLDLLQFALLVAIWITFYVLTP
jgi:hypothetical protein